MSLVSQDPGFMPSRSRSRSRSREPPKRSRRSTSRSSRGPLYRSLTSGGVHTLTKSVSLRMRVNSNGYVFDNGIVPSLSFNIWMTNQDVWIWGNPSNYTASNVPGYTDLAALFDEVMVEKVDITIFSHNDPTTSGTGSSMILYAKDYNDKVAPASLGDIQQYSDVRGYTLTNAYITKMSWSPKFLTYTLDSAGLSQASTPKTGFIRSNLAIDHYGIKGYIVNPPSNEQFHTYQFKIFYKCKVAK